VSLEPGRAAAIPGPHRAPRGRRRPVLGRLGAIPVVASSMRADQIPVDVIPAGVTATPARQVRAVTGGIPDPRLGAAAIQEAARRRAGCPP